MESKSFSFSWLRGIHRKSLQIGVDLTNEPGKIESIQRGKALHRGLGLREAESSIILRECFRQCWFLQGEVC